MVKITVNDSGSDPISQIWHDVANVIGDNVPYVIGFASAVRGDASAQRLRLETDNAQEWWSSMLGGGYMFYAEDMQIIVHTKDSENFQVTGGGQANVKTNSTAYRELIFKTTIGPRDQDLWNWSHASENARSGGWLSPVWGIGAQITDATLTAMHRNKVDEYLEKRRTFLMDLIDKGVPMTLNSTMFPELTVVNANQGGTSGALSWLEQTEVKVGMAIFNPATLLGGNATASNAATQGVSKTNTIVATLISCELQIPSGQEETVYSLKFREVIGGGGEGALEDQNTAAVDPSEPGTAPLP
jgi:hypothetical protein